MTENPADCELPADMAATIVPDINADRLRIAGVFNAYGGGMATSERDRQIAKQVLDVLPEAEIFAWENRAFLRRAVTEAAAAGLRQFVDIGCGGADAGSTHEFAQRHDPTATVVYVDIDPIAVAHRLGTLTDVPYTASILGDITEPAKTLQAVKETGLIDFGQPVVLVNGAVWHFVGDARGPARLIKRYRNHLVSGSRLVVSHVTHDEQGEAIVAAVDIYRQHNVDVTLRSRDEIATIFGEFGEFMDPGVVFTPQHRPDPGDDHPRGRESLTYGLVAIAGEQAALS